MRKGFTLVELSIVLVIIGLLIGGILVGQSLIDSAKLGKQVRQIQQLDIAVELFSQRFKRLPGDVDRNRDIGYVATSGQGCYTNWNSNPEVSTFYTDLSIVSFSPQTTFSSTTTGTRIATSGASQNALAAPLISGLAIFASPCPSYDLTPDDNYYEIGDYSNTVNLGYSPSNFTGNVQVLALDSKIDDGNTATGSVAIYSGYGGQSISIKMGTVN